MPSNKMKRRTEKADSDLASFLQNLRDDFNRANSLMPSPEKLGGYHNRFVGSKLSKVVETLQNTYKNATSVPQTPSQLLEVLDISPEEFGSVRTEYWKQHAIKAYGQLVPMQANDMLGYYLKELEKISGKLDCATLPDLLKLIGKDSTGREMIEAASKREGSGYVSDYQGKLNILLKPTNSPPLPPRKEM